MKRMLWWGLAACAVVPGVVLAGIAIADHARTYALHQRFDRLTAEQRIEALHQVGYQRDWRLSGLVRQQLQNPTGREELRAAGYAAMRLGEMDFLPILQKRADEGPDDATRATLMTYAARLSDRDARLVDWLARYTIGDEPWARVGAAAGLLHLGRLEAGPLLIAAARGTDGEITGFAVRELEWAAGPMAQAIGRPMGWLDAEPLPADQNAIDRLEHFWQQNVSTRLLNDVLARLTVRDRDWAEMGRLIHARDKVAKLLQ